MEIDKIIRRVDDLGRVVIPKSIREELKIQPGDFFSFQLEDSKLILRPYDEEAQKEAALDHLHKAIEILHEQENCREDLVKFLITAEILLKGQA